MQASNGYISVRTREKIRIKVRYTRVYPRLPAVGRFHFSISSYLIIGYYIFPATYLEKINIILQLILKIALAIFEYIFFLLILHLPF